MTIGVISDTHNRHNELALGLQHLKQSNSKEIVDAVEATITEWADMRDRVDSLTHIIYI